jgi:hypothetical protein
MNNTNACVYNRKNVLLRSLGTIKHFEKIEEHLDQYKHKGTWWNDETNLGKNLITKAYTNDSRHSCPTPMGE